MSIEGEHFDITITAGADLRLQQNKVVIIAGTIAASNDLAIGVVTTQPNSGEHCSVAVQGHMKGYAGAAISKGVRVKATSSGYLLTVASGDGAVGKALVAANSGDLFDFFGDFSGAATTI